MKTPLVVRAALPMIMVLLCACGDLRILGLSGGASNSSSTVAAITPFSPAPGTVDIVQSHYYSTAQNGFASIGSVSATYAGPQSSGNLNLVVVAWYDATSTVTSVMDSAGNAYALAIGPTRQGTVTQSIFYAPDIVASSAGTNTVTVKFNSNVQPVLRIFEYTGLSTASPVDVTAANTGTTASLSSGNLTTTQANELVFSATFQNGGTALNSVTNGRLRQTLTDVNAVVQDAAAASVGAYSFAASVTGASAWIYQTVAFKETAAPIAPTFDLQQATANITNAATTSLSTTFFGSQGSGNANVVMVGTCCAFGNTITSLTDSAGNAYVPILGPTVVGAETQWTYYVPNIKAQTPGANTVTVVLSSGNVNHITMQAEEYSGASAFDTGSGSSGLNGPVTIGPFSTRFANELVLSNVDAKNCWVSAPASGFRYLLNYIGSRTRVVSDETLSTAASVDPTMPLSCAENWAGQTAAFH